VTPLAKLALILELDDDDHSIPLCFLEAILCAVTKNLLT